jgi:hypothetical protein
MSLHHKKPARPVTYYHGGPQGRSRGAYILPPSITGAMTTADFGAGSVCDRGKVYVTTSYEAALIYAAGHRRGVVYEVLPVGTLLPDPDCSEPGLSFECEKAVVRKVIKPAASDLRMALAALVAP